MNWKNILKQTGIISAIHLTTKILGFLEKVLIAYLFGTSHISDAYFLVFAIFIILFDFFNETTSPALLPEYVQKNKVNRGREVLSEVFSFYILIGMGLSVIFFFFAPQILTLITNLPEKTFTVAVVYLKIMSLGIGFIIASISTYLFINSKQKFLPASLGDLLFKITGSLFILAVLLNKDLGLTTLAIGIALGSLAKLSTHLIYLRKCNIAPKINIKEKKSILKIFRLSLPMVAGIFFAKSRIIFDNFIVSGMKIGSITAMQYGYRVMEFSIVVILEPFSTVIFPELVYIREKTIEFINKISFSLKILLAIFLPVSLMTFLFRIEIVTVLFERGAFDSNSIKLTATVFSFYALSMVFVAIDFLFSKSLFSLRDIKFPALFEILSITFHITFVLLLKSKGLFIVSLAFLINRALKTALLSLRLRIKLDQKPRFFKKNLAIVAFNFGNIIIIYLIKGFLYKISSNLIFIIFTSGVIFISLYFAELYLSGILKHIIAHFKED